MNAKSFYEITATAGASYTITQDLISMYYISATSINFAGGSFNVVDPGGVVGNGWIFNAEYRGTKNTNATVNGIIVFGTQMPTHLINKRVNISARYNESAWSVNYEPGLEESDIISTSHVINNNITLSKIEAVPSSGNTAYIPSGSIGSNLSYSSIRDGYWGFFNNKGVLNDFQFSGDILVTAGGATTITGSAITTDKIANTSVTTDKLANLTSGMIYVGSAANRPTAVNMSGVVAISNTGVTSIVNNTIAPAKLTNAAANQIPIGDSTTGVITYRSLSGDVTNVDGTMTIADNVITTAKLADSSVTEAKLKSTVVTTNTTGPLAAQRKDITGFKALLDGSVHNLFALKAGDVILDVVVYISGASGVAQTIDIGFDASVNLTGTGADTNGCIEAADSNVVGAYSCLNTSYDGVAVRTGTMTVLADGYITVAASSDLTATGIIAFAYITYIPA